jgi:methyl-accepting chemotaxis protein
MEGTIVRLTVRNKLFAAFGAVLALLIIGEVVAITKMGSINGKGATVGQVDLPSIKILGEVATHQGEYRTAQMRSAAVTAPVDIDAAIGLMRTADSAVQKGFKDYAPLVSNDSDRTNWTEAQATWKAYVDGTADVGTLARAGNREGAAKAAVAAKSQFDAAGADLTKWTDFNSQLADHDVAAAASTYTSARTLMIILATLATLIGAVMALFIARGISRGVDDVLDRLSSLQDRCATELLAGLEAMAAGDLTVKVTPVTKPIDRISNDEIGQVAHAVNGIRERFVASIEAYNAMAEKLRAMIGSVAGSASSVSSASQQMASTSEEAGKAVGEIASAVGEVAQGAERQVRQVDSVNKSANEAASAAATSAKQAKEAAEVAEQARAAAREGVGSAEEATQAMRAVRDSSESVSGAIRDLASKSEEIGAIVATITGIAGQTNLLALNAAIEAARAGEQGRGFAVVAEEVRKLAEESQRAAQEIAKLIEQIQGETTRTVSVVENSTQQTEQGAVTVEQTREAFMRIGDAVEDVNSRIAQIAGAAEQISAETARMQGEIAEVASVAEQSSASAEQVSASTQQTSASTQEIAASAQELASTASDLEALVAQFKVAA